MQGVIRDRIVWIGILEKYPYIWVNLPSMANVASKVVKDMVPQIVKRVAQLASQGQTIDEVRWELIGGRQLALKMPVTTLEFYDVVNHGIPKVSIDILAELLDIPMTKMAALLNLSYKTLTRKDRKSLLDPVVSSHTYEMSNLIAKGLEVFEDGERLKRWLNKENRALKGKKPLDLMNTPTGIRLVMQVLGRLEEGVYS